MAAGRVGRAAMVGAMVLAASALASAQTCTTQAKMPPNVRQELSSRALELATAIKSGDSGTVGRLSSAEIANNFAQTGFLIQNLSQAIGGDSLAVTQLYQLDANAHVAGQNAPADFNCPLINSGSEVDFSIEGLPPGMYSFAMVEAAGPRPFVLAFLLKQETGQWKMAGFYPHTRAAAGHDGLWYWNDARAKARAGQAWSAWLEYGLANQLLRPANFVSTTHLDKLLTERGASAPPELRDGLSTQTPLVVKGTDASFAITDLSAAPSEDGKHVNLVLHFRADPMTDPAAERTRNVSAAKALLTAHPGLRQGFDNVMVFADVQGQQPFVTQLGMNEVQ